MKSIVQIIFFILLCITSYAQSIPKSVVSNAGTSAQSGGYVLHWTLGEMAISLRSSTDINLQEGFWQSELGIVKNKEPMLRLLPILIYPNPTLNEFTVKILESSFPLTANLYAINGSLLRAWNITSDISTCDISAYPSGAYRLYIIDTHNHSFSKFIIKH
jgi:Secretion system C-terminal sorting domain